MSILSIVLSDTAIPWRDTVGRVRRKGLFAIQVRYAIACHYGSA
ncbi:hypothetical protein [Nitrosomonas sp.]|nr:hypothetical protein [Nitrosomonas sp.]